MPKQTAKDYWKDRLVGRINAQIEKIETGNAELLMQLEDEAQKKAMDSLGISDALQKRQAIQQRIKELESEIKGIEQRVAKHLEEVHRICVDGWTLADGIEVVMADRQRSELRRLLEATEPGKEISRLERAREYITDKLWLANGPSQIKAVCSEVDELLGEED